MSDPKKTETRSTPIEESYQPQPNQDRGYTPLSQRPAGKPPEFTPPPGSGAPSGGGGSEGQSSSGGDSSDGGEKK